MHVVQMSAYRNRELVAVLRELLAMAEADQAHGLAFVVKLGERSHHAGTAGDYTRYPEQAMAATFRLERHLMQGRAPFDGTNA